MLKKKGRNRKESLSQIEMRSSFSKKCKNDESIKTFDEHVSLLGATQRIPVRVLGVIEAPVLGVVHGFPQGYHSIEEK